ncbi:MAG: hypothetical protein KKC53_04750 [Actinobacteria bacterium]|nr:hypothetical protein [Actinomycetota bacterium]
MKKKYYFVILFLVLAIFLTGCSGGGIVTPATDEAKIKSVINEYFLAINDQNWSKAKSYCVYGSDQYYSTCLFEDAVNVLEQYYGNVTVTCFTNISNVSVNGSYASAFVSINLIATAGYYYESDSISGYYYLQKTGNNWKIYDGKGFE